MNIFLHKIIPVKEKGITRQLKESKMLFPIHYLVNFNKIRISEIASYPSALSKENNENHYQKSIGLVKYLYTQTFSKSIPEDWYIKFWDKSNKAQYLWGLCEGFNRNTPAIAYTTEKLIIIADKSRTIRLMPHEIGHLYSANKSEAVPIFMNLAFFLKYVELFGYDYTAKDLLGGFTLALFSRSKPLTNNKTFNRISINSNPILKYHYPAKLIFEYILNKTNLDQILKHINVKNFDFEEQLQININKNLSLDDISYEQIILGFYNFLLNNIGGKRTKEVNEIIYDFSREFSIYCTNNDYYSTAFVNELWEELITSKNKNQFFRRTANQIKEYYKEYPLSGNTLQSSIEEETNKLSEYESLHNKIHSKNEKIQIIKISFSSYYTFYFKKRTYEIVKEIANNNFKIYKRF